MTVEETEDVVFYALEAEQELNWQYDEALGIETAYGEYCSQYPWNCDSTEGTGGGESALPSGPSAPPASHYRGCGQEVMGAVGGVLGGMAAWAGSWLAMGSATSAVAAGTLTTGIAVATGVVVVAGIAGGVALAVAGVWGAYNCYQGLPVAPAEMEIPYVSEPVY